MARGFLLSPFMNPSEKKLTIHHAAKLIGVSTANLYSAIKSKRLHPETINGKKYITWEDLACWLEARVRDPKSKLPVHESLKEAILGNESETKPYTFHGK